MSQAYPSVTPHGEIQEIFKDVFIVQGSVFMMPEFQISRNMIILREGESLTLISTIRLDEKTLEVLDALGKVENIVKLGAYHLGKHNGIDDPFYMDRYKAKLWAMPEMTHKEGLETTNSLITDSIMPIKGLSLFNYESSKLPEGLLLINKEGGILISCDSLQNWCEPDTFINEMALERLKEFGFIKPANVGPQWRNFCEPEDVEFKRVLDLDFKHLLPSHGQPILNTAKEEFRSTFKEIYGI